MRMILDSGARQEFESGAVRDVAEGKGRCDLLPIDVIADILYDEKGLDILYGVRDFVKHRDVSALEHAILSFAHYCLDWSVEQMLLEVSKHFEEGAKKYAERNWEKGIPLHCYVDSGIRHLLKHLDGYTDERHDRAFVWNMMCLWWTYEHKPELDDLPKEESK